MKYSITTSPLVPVIMAITLIYQLNFIPLFIVGGFSIYCIYFYIILIQKEKNLSKGYTHKSISKYTPIQIIANQEETKIDSLFCKKSPINMWICKQFLVIFPLKKKKNLM